MNHDRYDDRYIEGILRSVRRIAMVGASANIMRPSYFVLKYLLDKGYEVDPVNPGLAGKTILDRKVYGSLTDLTETPDMVEVFRNAEAAGPNTDDAIDLGARIVWMQLGVRNDAAAERAEAAGLSVVMNRCPKIEYGRHSGEICWVGVNTRKISSRRPARAPGLQHLTLRALR